MKQAALKAAGGEFTAIADWALAQLVPAAARDTERLFGKIAGQYAIIALGKMGGGELNFKSDLDIMLVYNGAGSEDKTHYSKLTRRIITALSAVTEEGGLYEADMALRPSGRSGPLAVSVAAFQSYYERDAWTWEFMALSRARIVYASSARFADKIDESIDKILRSKDYQGVLASDIQDMRARLTRDKPACGPWDVKNLPGGLRDAEFIAQFLMLKHRPEVWPRSTSDMLDCARNAGWLSGADYSALVAAHDFYHSLIQIAAMTSEGQFDADTAPRAQQMIVARAVGCVDIDDVRAMKLAHLRACECLADKIIA